MIIDVMIPKRYVGPLTTSAATAAPAPTTTRLGRQRGTNTAGSRGAAALARVGSLLPSTNSATITTSSGTTSLKPDAAQPGHHGFVDRCVSWDWTAPNASPAPTANPTDESCPSSAAANAGTTNNAKPAGSSVVAAAARIATAPPIADPAIQLAAARRGGEYPSSSAERSSSAAARNAVPLRVKRSTAQTTAASATTITVRWMRSTGNTRSPSGTVPDGSTGCTERGVEPKRIETSACRVTSSPSEATTLASAGARRSGWNTSTCASAPINALERIPATTAAAVASVRCTRPA